MHAFDLGAFLVHDHVKAQRAFHDSAFDLPALRHFGDNGRFGAGDDLGQRLLGGRLQADFGLLDTQKLRHFDEVVDDGHFLRQIRQRDDRHVAEDQEFVIVERLGHGHVGEDGAVVHEAFFLVQDGLHVAVCGEQAFHEKIPFAGVDQFHSPAGGGEVGIRVHDTKHGGVDPFLLAHFFDLVFVPDQDAFDEVHCHSLMHSANGVGVHRPGRHEALVGQRPQDIEHLVQFGYLH